MTTRESFITRTAKHLTASTFRRVQSELGQHSDTATLYATIERKALKATDEYLSEDAIQDEIATWDRSRLTFAIVRKITDRIDEAIKSYEINRRLERMS